jgi:HEAT repeat protein
VEVVLRARDRTDDAVELGSFPAREAADFLLEVARGSRGSPGEEDALFPVVLADVEEIWRELMILARDRAVDEDVRSGALFWVGQEAAAAVTEGLADVALDEDEDQDVREAAVFALSRRPADEGVPILMEIARTARQADTRRSAMFWLAESEDERVYAFFEQILVGRGGG